MPRPQFQIRHLMLGVLGCSLLAAALRVSEEWRGVILIFGGPALGSLIHQSKGGRGIVGGAIGGGICGLSIGIYVYGFNGPVRGDLIGPVIAIPVLTMLLATVGLIIGALIWGLRIQVEDRDARYPWWSTPEPSEPNRRD